MKILHKERQKGKTNDIFWLAHENQPSVILVPRQVQKDIIEKKYFKGAIFKDIHTGKYKPDIKVEVFKDYIRNIVGQHDRKIFVDDLDLCLQTLFDQSVEIGSITDRPCDRAIKENRLKEKDGKMVCPGYIYGMNESVCRDCECCPYQYAHPFDAFWSKRHER